MYKQISEKKFNHLLYNTYKQGSTYQKKESMIAKDKMRFTYDLWLQKYKGKTVHEITVEEHAKWSKEYQSWKTGNIEKL